jgi:hypothetical protein
VIATNDQSESTDYIQDISVRQLFVFDVDANYKLCTPIGLWVTATHLCNKTNAKRWLARGDSSGEKASLRGWYTASARTSLSSTSAKGKALLTEIRIKTEFVFDEVNYQLMGPAEEASGGDLANRYSERDPRGL